MTASDCLNCGHPHIFIDEGNFCSKSTCWCSNYMSDGRKVLVGIQRAIEGLRTTEEQVKYMLTNIPELRELNNKDFVFTYWHFTMGYVIPPALRKKMVDPETIRRGKQLICEHHPELKPKGEDINYAKMLKEWGYREEVINQK